MKGWLTTRLAAAGYGPTQQAQAAAIGRSRNELYRVETFRQLPGRVVCERLGAALGLPPTAFWELYRHHRLQTTGEDPGHLREDARQWRRPVG